MFIQRFKKTVGKKTYTSVFLIENYRENGTIKRRYLLNLSKWPQQHINAMEPALKSSRNGQVLVSRNPSELQIFLRKTIGGIAVVKALLDRLCISFALGQAEQAKLVSLMIEQREWLHANEAKIFVDGSDTDPERLSQTAWGSGSIFFKITGSRG